MDRRVFIKNSFKAMMISTLGRGLSSCLSSGKSPQYDFPLSSNEMNYFQINLYGGPIRWAYDSFLRPKETLDFRPTAMVGSQFSDSDGGVALKNIQKFGFDVPHFWGLKLHNGREHSFLLENMLTIRGVDINVLGHPLGSIKTVRPESEHESIHGLLSDRSSSPLPAVIMGSNPATRSYAGPQRGGIIVPLGKENLIEYILGPFVMAPEKSLWGKSERKDIVLKKVLHNLKEVEGGNNSYLKEFRSSLEIFIENLDPFLREYEELLNQYEGVVSKNIHNYSGLGLDKLKLQNLRPTKREDWGRYKVDYHSYLGGNNLEEMLSSAHLGTLAAQFACSDFLLGHGLASSLMISTPNEMGCFLYNCGTQGNYLDQSFEQGKLVSIHDPFCPIQMDSHNTGTILTMAASFMFFRGLTACLDQLISSLKKKKSYKGKNLFDHTLIHLTSEFERVPTLFESGTDHNDHSHTSSFISGSIDKFDILGNIKVGEGKLGTIGTMAPVSFLDRPIEPRDIYHSICDILKKPNPLPRSKSLVEWKDGKIQFKYQELKNIPGASA